MDGKNGKYPTKRFTNFLKLNSTILNKDKLLNS